MATASKSTDAITLLRADHDKVKKMFKDFERLHKDGSDEDAELLAKEICDELTVHTTIEEELFYPPLRAALDDDDLLDEAEVEHASAKDLIAQIRAMSASDDKFAAKVTVLGEYIDHHVKEEHDEMFPKARKTELDMAALGEDMLSRKKELMAEMGIDADAPPKRASKSAAATRHATRH
jgi:hemerythrin-like domain-containing protein